MKKKNSNIITEETIDGGGKFLQSFFYLYIYYVHYSSISSAVLYTGIYIITVSKEFLYTLFIANIHLRRYNITYIIICLIYETRFSRVRRRYLLLLLHYYVLFHRRRRQSYIVSFCYVPNYYYCRLGISMFRVFARQ